MPTPMATRRSRPLALLAAALLAVVLAVVVVLVTRVGSDRPPSPRHDIGAQSDPTALAQVVEKAVREQGADGRAPSPDATCAAEVRASYGQGLGPLVYAARLRWEGAPAVLLTYRLQPAGSSGLDHRAFVLALSGCRLLVVQSL